MKKHVLLALLIGCAWGVATAAEDTEETISLDDIPTEQTTPPDMDATEEAVTPSETVEGQEEEEFVITEPSQATEAIATSTDAINEQATAQAPKQKTEHRPKTDVTISDEDLDTDELPALPLEIEAE